MTAVFLPQHCIVTVTAQAQSASWDLALQQHWRSQPYFCLSWDRRQLVCYHTRLSAERVEPFSCCSGEGNQENFISNVLIL